MTGLAGFQNNVSLAADEPPWLPMVGGRFRLGVTGGRAFGDLILVQRVFMTLNLGSRVTLVHGVASGADRLAKSVVEDLFPQWDLDPFPADWNRRCDDSCRHGVRRRRDGSVYCPQAGPIRNQEMVDSRLDLLVAFAGGDGTADMVRRARAAGILVLRVEE